MVSSSEQAHSRLPNPTSTTPYWRTQPHDLDEFCSSETVPAIIDVAIIGGGLSGACTAYHLLAGTENSATAAPNIAIFEAREACSGATGRNGGHTKLAPVWISKFATKYGPAAALDFTLFLRELMREMKTCAENVITNDALDDEHDQDLSKITLAQECELLVTRSFDVFLDERHAVDAEKEWNEAARGMQEVAKQEGREHDLEWLGDVQFLKGKIAEQATSIRGAKAALSCPSISLWPYKFVLGLLQHVVKLGAKLYTLTPVTCIERVSEDEAGPNIIASSTKGFTALHTPRGITLAKKVIFSSNAYVSNLLQQYENTIIPGRGTACRIVRTPSLTNPADINTAPAPKHARLVNTYNINGGPTSREYLVPRPDGSIILGGGQPLYRAEKSIWYDMVDDGTLIEGVRERWFEGYMGRHFYGWDADGKDEKIDRIWTGIMGYTEDSWPNVGLVPGESDHFILAGFNGSGMASIFLVARGIARMVRDGISFEETGMPEVFKSVPGRIKAVVSDS